MGAKTLIVNFLLIALFALSMITFGSQLAIDNNADQSILDDSRINESYGDLQKELEDTRETSNTQKDKFQSEDPEVGEENLIFRSIKTVLTSFSSMIIGLYSVTLGLVSEVIFGSGFAALFSVLSAILGIIIVLISWQVFRTGRAD